MVRVNLAQESPVGISVLSPGGARVPGIPWAWLTTQNPSSAGEAGAGDGAWGPNIQVLCALLTAATHLGSCHLSAFPTYLTPCRLHFISCQLFSKTHSERSWTRGIIFGTSQGTPRSAAGCCKMLHSASAVSSRCGGTGGLAPAAPHR